MKRIEDIKGKIVEIPEVVKRYVVATWSNSGWRIWNGYNLFTTPEDAVQDLLQSQSRDIEYYTVVELELKIPISN